MVDMQPRNLDKNKIDQLIYIATNYFLKIYFKIAKFLDICYKYG